MYFLKNINIKDIMKDEDKKAKFIFIFFVFILILLVFFINKSSVISNDIKQKDSLGTVILNNKDLKFTVINKSKDEKASYIKVAIENNENNDISIDLEELIVNKTVEKGNFNTTIKKGEKIIGTISLNKIISSKNFKNILLKLRLTNLKNKDNKIYNLYIE